MQMRITIMIITIIIIRSCSFGQTASGLINPDPGIIATVSWHRSSWLIFLRLFLKTVFKAVISCFIITFLHHRCDVLCVRVGVFTFFQPCARPFCHFALFLSKWRRERRVWVFETQRWTEADRIGHTGQRGGEEAKEDLRLHGEQDWHIQTGENIVLLSNKATYSGGDDGGGCWGGIYPRPQEGRWNLLIVIVNKNSTFG